jgi:hypothetical protein
VLDFACFPAEACVAGCAFAALEAELAFELDAAFTCVFGAAVFWLAVCLAEETFVEASCASALTGLTNVHTTAKAQTGASHPVTIFARCSNGKPSSSAKVTRPNKGQDQTGIDIILYRMTQCQFPLAHS